VAALAPAEIAERVADVRRRLADLGRRSRGLETFGGEARLVLAGWPNIGKSSLFNRLLEADRAIVAPESGTTRDELRAALHLEDPATGTAVTAVLSDTAGLDEARDELAGKARAKAIEAIGRADLVLLCLDATVPSYERMDEVLGLVAAPMVAAVTKCDLAGPERASAYLESRGVQAEAVATSALTGQGVGRLREALARAVAGGTVDREPAGPVMGARHRSALEESAKALGRAERLGRRGAGAELVALELREALAALGAIVGRDAGGEVLERIFSRFCVGK
jgi:tRNA modification GTPase